MMNGNNFIYVKMIGSAGGHSVLVMMKHRTYLKRKKKMSGEKPTWFY
jgi:hypothetical protein